MAVAQPHGIVNLLLLTVCGVGAWFVAAWTKPHAAVRASRAVEASGGLRNEPGVFASDARQLVARKSAGASDFDELAIRYGSGSIELRLLTPALMESWAARDPAGAASAGLSRCFERVPDALPEVVSAIAARQNEVSSDIIQAIPDGTLRLPCLLALAAAWGSAARNEALQLCETLPRHERTGFVREWHRARSAVDTGAAEKSAGDLKDPDDQAAARTGCLLARAAASPETMLRESSARDDFPLIASTAFRHWLPVNPGAAWNFAISLKDDPRFPAIAADMLQFEFGRRRPSEAMPEIQTQFNRLFVSGPPLEVLAAVIPFLAAEQTAVAQRFVEMLPKTALSDFVSLRDCATVLLFDNLCITDPAAAWRVAEAHVQVAGAKDARSSHQWKSAMAREHATLPERVAAGFPDFTDMTNLALHWVESDTPAALSTFCNPAVQAPLQRLAIETALSADGVAIPLPQLIEWAKNQPAQLLRTIEAVAAQ